VKTKFKVVMSVFVVGFAFTLGVCLAPVLKKSRSARAGDYLPDIPPIAGVSVINQETTGSNHCAARHFVFRPNDSSGIKNCSDVMMRIEARLQTSGWEKIQGNAGSAVASTVWHDKDKWGGGVHLLCSITQPNASMQEYFGTIEAFPFYRTQP
jgi:hypothetical protein